MRRASPARALPWSAVSVLAALACLAFAGAAGSAPGPGPLGPPQRDHDRGHWFAHTCAQAPAGQAACGAQVVTNSSGVPLAGGAAPTGAYGPAQFHGAYNLPAGGSTKTIAIVDAYDDPNAAADLAAYDSAYGLPQLNTYSGASTPSPWFRKVNQSGGTTPPAGDSGWGLEIALDIETAHEICQSCNILLVEASSAYFSDLGTAENEAAALGANVISNSWGGGEFSSETLYDSYFNHPGVVITASTGDNGYGVEYPSSSQYVVGIGGTTLHVNGSGSTYTYGSEAAWSGAGSGCSRYETKPSWQHDTGCSKHTVADVSADADPNTGAAVYDTYGYSGWYQVGGTSLASPLIAAVFALSGNTSNGAAPYSNPSALNDVVGGSNGGCGTYLCNAVSGYDGPTGLGTPNGLAAFSGAPASPDFSLTATPSSQTVTQGGTATYTVAMTPSGGFSNSVSVTVSGAPGSPAGCNVTSTQSCQISIPTTSSTSIGAYSLAFTGTGGGLTHTANASLTVNAPATGDFSLSISPSNPTLFTPGHVSYTVTVGRLNGFTGSVTLSVSGLPSGLTGSFGTNPTTSTSTLTITASKRFPRQTYTFTVTGKSGSLTHTTTGRISTR